MSNRKTSLFSKFSRQASHEFEFPLYLSIIFQALSYFQILASIIKGTFPDAVNSTTATKFLKKIFVVTSIFGEWDIFSSTITAQAIWGIFIAYIGIQVLLLAGVLLMLFFQIRQPLFYKILSLSLLIHSRLLFYPIHYFFLQIIGLTTYDKRTVDSFFRNQGVLVATIGLVIINITLSFVKEMWLYRVTKSKNTYASHSNLANQLVLFHKILIPFILLVPNQTSTTSAAIAIISILHSILMTFILYSKLPLYNYHVMRFTYFLSAMIFPTSIFGLFNTFISSKDVLETLLVVGTAIIAKIAMVILNEQFERILSGDISKPENAIYYPVLLKLFTAKNSGLILARKHFPIQSLYYYSTFDPKLDEQKNLKDRRMSRLRKQEFYTAILDKLLSSRTNYQRSAILMLYMAKIYMNKLDNAAKALDLIRKVTALSSSIPVRNSIESFQASLQEAYFKKFSYSSEDLELSKYFIYREEFVALKENMQLEIKLHLDFWQQISQDDTNVKKVVDLSNQIDTVYLKIKDRWQKSSERFASVYPSSLLMYGLYLDTIRGLPQESMQAIQKFYNYNKNADYKKKMTSLSENSAIIITSMEKEKIGQVVDASNTVESLFEVTKENLVGDKINTLMPTFIAKNHDSWMEQYSLTGAKGGSIQISSYAKKMNGTLMQIEINVKLYPYLDKGVNLMGHVQMKSLEEHSFIVKPEGSITECSPQLLEMLNKLGINLKHINMFEACRKFASINEAFNIVYSPKDANKGKGEESTTPNKLRFLTDDQYTIQNTINYTNMETLGDQLGPQKLRTEAIPLFNNHTEIDNFDTVKPAFTFTSSFKSKYHTSEFKSVTGPKVQIVLSEDEAHEICEEYRSYGNLKLKIKNPNGGAKHHKVQLDIIIEPYVVENNVYKIIKVIDGQIDDRESIESNFETRKRLFTQMEKSDQYDPSNNSAFASSMPSQGSAPSAGDIPEERSVRMEYTREDSKANKSFVKKQMSIAKESDSKLPTQKKFDSLGQMNTKEDFQNIDIRQSITGKSSTKSYSHMDFKLIKTLHDFFGERKVRLVTRISIYSVYLIMVAVLVLAFINFFFTQRSLTEIDNGVEIVDLVSKRLTSALRSWQYMLLIYARAAGLRPRSTIAGLIATNLGTESRNMQEINGDLRSKINLIGSDEIIEEVFSSKTRFYDPMTQKTLTNGNLDIFTANNILSLANRAISNTSLTDTDIITMSEPLMSINNTANDFLVSSETQITQIIGGLQNIISKNISLLTTILIFENVALVLLCIALIFVVRVVLKSYSRTFTAIVRITNESISERIYKITKFQTSLNENIEAKSFLTNLNLYLEFHEDTKVTQKMILKGKDKKQRFFNKRFTMRDFNFHAFQYLAISFFFILVIAGLFVTLFVQSNNSFDTLNGISDQLSVTSTLSYQSSLLVANFYDVLIFQNRTDILVRNSNAEDQLELNLDTFSNVNDELLRTLFNVDSDDSVIESFLQNDICSYLSTSIQSTCIDSTQNGSLGLLSFNLKFYRMTNNYVDMFYGNKTLDMTKFVCQYYFSNVTLDITVLDAAYTFLTSHILQGFNSEVSDLETVNVLLSMGSVLFILVATFMIQQISLRTFINLDNSQKKIFRTLTYYVFSQNKSVGFLLKKEFGDTIEGLNRILYV